jgi:16S rRNA (uracil1498-N3)-methyltransferase
MAKANSFSTSVNPSEDVPASSDFPGGSDFFYVPPDHVHGDYLELEGDEVVHLSHVMRKKPGESIIVVDGAGCAYRVLIETIDRRTARCRIDARQPRFHEPALQLTVGIALLKHPAAMDYAVEKLTEIGVGSIMPMVTARTITRHARTERWQKLALAAMKQSGRCVLPIVAETAGFADIIGNCAPADARLIPHEAVRSPHIADSITGGEKSAAILIGPEGGFTDAEISEARQAGFEPVSLGERRLRAETAAVVAAAFTLRSRQP